MKTSGTVDKCEMCNGVGIVGGHAPDGSFDAMDCPECTVKYEHPRNDEVAMTVDEALTHADEWTKGQTFYPGAQGWRVVCAVLAAEVRRLRDHIPDGTKMVEPVKPFAYTSKAGLNYENIGENYGALPVRSCMVFGDFDHIFDQPIWLHPIIKNYSIDAETRALVLELCRLTIDNAGPNSMITRAMAQKAEKLKKLLGAE